MGRPLELGAAASAAVEAASAAAASVHAAACAVARRPQQPAGRRDGAVRCVSRRESRRRSPFRRVLPSRDWRIRAARIRRFPWGFLPRRRSCRRGRRSRRRRPRRRRRRPGCDPRASLRRAGRRSPLRRRSPRRPAGRRRGRPPRPRRRPRSSRRGPAWRRRPSRPDHRRGRRASRRGLTGSVAATRAPRPGVPAAPWRPPEAPAASMRTRHIPGGTTNCARPPVKPNSRETLPGVRARAGEEPCRERSDDSHEGETTPPERLPLAPFRAVPRRPAGVPPRPPLTCARAHLRPSSESSLSDAASVRLAGRAAVERG